MRYLLILRLALLEVHVAFCLLLGEGEIGAGGLGAYLTRGVGECGLYGDEVALLLQDMRTQSEHGVGC